MSLNKRLDGVIEKLQEFKDGSDDSTETTPSILRNMATFVEDELGDVISELEAIADEVEALEEDEG